MTPFLRPRAAVYNTYVFAVLLFLTGSAMAQHTTAAAGQEVRDPGAGFTFTLPAGWVYQQTPQGIVIGHNTIPGMVLVLPLAARTLQELQAELMQGLQSSGEALQLYPSGDMQPWGQNGIAFPFSGLAEQQPVNGYSVNVLSPHGGGLSISALVASPLYTPEHAGVVEAIAKSLRFSQPEPSPVVEQWIARLSNRRLTYIDSHYSSGASYGGYMTGGGWSDKKTYDLCGDGTFRGRETSSMSFDAGGGFGSSNSDSGQQVGQWRVIAFAGQPILEARFADGSTGRFALSDQNGQTFLDNQRWYVTDEAACW